MSTTAATATEKPKQEEQDKGGRREVKQNVSDKAFGIAMIVLLCICVPFLIGASMIYNYGQANKPEGYKYPEFKQLWMTAVGGITFSVFREFTDCVFDPLWRYLIPHKGDDYAFEKKVAKAKRNFTGFFYFLLSTYWGYITIKDSKWLPDFLGGKNPEASISHSFVALFPETPPGTHCYILFTYGYHCQDFLRHLMIPIDDRDNDWREMFLHHVAAVCLYPGFIFSNVMGVGVVLAWLHDIADIAVNLCRLVLTLDLKIPAFLCYLVMVTLWIYTRLIVLPIYIYRILTEYEFPAPVEHFQFLMYLELVFLSIMQVLHIHWFILFIKMGMRFVTKGKAVDLVHTIDDVTVKKAKKNE